MRTLRPCMTSLSCPNRSTYSCILKQCQCFFAKHMIHNHYAWYLQNCPMNISGRVPSLVKKLVWGMEQDKPFQRAKTDALFAHFDPEKPLILACYALDCGIGPILLHFMEDLWSRSTWCYVIWFRMYYACHGCLMGIVVTWLPGKHVGCYHPI